MSETQARAATGVHCWNELLTTDANAARAFYTKLLGWTVKEKDMGPAGTYTIFVNNGTDVCGCMKHPAPNAPSAWMSYIAVDDVDASTKRAAQLGATVCVEPQDIPDLGRFSVLTDPTGGTIGLFQYA